ncbi:hypothetical protein MTO96_038350 [Rhipicephalus appendiculatus]
MGSVHFPWLRAATQGSAQFFDEETRRKIIAFRGQQLLRKRAPRWGTTPTFVSRHAGGPANPHLASDDTDPLRRRVSYILA